MFGRWWHGIPENPIEQDEFGNTRTGIDRKLQDAQFYLDEMGRSLDRPNGRAVARVSAAGANVEMQWEQPFYAHVGAFLANARSVPEIIESCFGADWVLKKKTEWFGRLSVDEQTRREKFSKQFRRAREKFSRHPLTQERHASEHRRGFSSVEGKVIGPFGKVHTASPVQRVPSAESRLISPDDDPADPAVQWAATLPPQPVQPKRDQFAIGGKPLFDECRAYFALAQQLVQQARGICQRVHGTDSLTAPPSS